MDKIIYFLIIIIVLIILGHCIVKNREKFSVGFSPNDMFFIHGLNKNQRHSYDLFVEDENLTFWCNSVILLLYIFPYFMSEY